MAFPLIAYQRFLLIGIHPSLSWQLQRIMPMMAVPTPQPKKRVMRWRWPLYERMICPA